MKRFVAAVVALAFVGFVGVAQAADDPTGTWKWETNFGGKTRENTAKLKAEGEKLTGVYISGQNNMETPIENGTFKDGKISFSITREFNNNKFTIKYNGTVKGDTITGKSEFDRDGQSQSRDWEAKRQK